MRGATKTIFLLLVLLIFVAGCSKTETFKRPDIKDDFCGVYINYQYCKCGFHNQYCDAVKMSQRTANTYVRNEYMKWVRELLDNFLTDCELSGGIPGFSTCTYCDEGYMVENKKCIPIELAEEEKETSAFQADGPLNDDCTINQAQFNKDWKKYSDIDDRIAINDRSYEAKQALTVYDQMIEKMIQSFELERDIEIETQMQNELIEYKNALVQNIKTNLLKSFWRLSWVTYSTIKSGTGLGNSYSDILTKGAGVETIGAGLKVIQGTIPGNSQLAIDTSTIGGKALSVGANTALEAVDTLGDPTKIATELFKSASMAPMPSADISPEEIEILRTQHLTNGAIDKALADSRTENARRQASLTILEQEIADLQKEITGWEAKEKERVKSSLESSCNELKKQHEKEN